MDINTAISSEMSTYNVYAVSWYQICKEKADEWSSIVNKLMSTHSNNENICICEPPRKRRRIDSDTE
jgi:hypothetical protein